MHTVYKYPLDGYADRQTIELPKGAQPLSVQFQNGQLCLWALVDTNLGLGRYTVQMYGTGHEIDADDLPVGHEFLGTVQVSGGVLVFHLFGYFRP